MSPSIIITTLQTVAGYVNSIIGVANYSQTKSLTEVTKLTRVEPLTIISKDCLNLEYMADINQTVLNLFAGYYLQAISLLTTINSVKVIRVLDSLNPDRDSTGFLLGDKDDSSFLAKESIANLSLENYKYDLPTSRSLALEVSDSTLKSLNEVSALSVGKMLNVEIMTGGENSESKKQSVTVPVNVRLMVSVLPNLTINKLLTLKTEDNSITERYHLWRAGRIGFIKDLIFCQDLIDEYKKATVGDESGTLQEILRRVNNSKKFGLLSRNPSLVSASNIFIITEDVARDIESKLGGKLSNPHIRQKAFDNTYAMLLVVVDREWERVTFYSRGIAASTDLSVKEIKAASKGKGPDIGDILKSLQMGMPSF